jgi:hypothetical protein
LEVKVTNKIYRLDFVLAFWEILFKMKLNLSSFFSQLGKLGEFYNRAEWDKSGSFKDKIYRIQIIL